MRPWRVLVAGVLRDAHGRVLLASRTEGRDLAGLWEFPGGKVEAGESPDVALVRELREELGIRAKVGESVIRVPQQYPGKRLVLDVRHVEFEGEPEGLDGQALAWVPLEALAGYPMPPADLPVVAALTQPDRYLVTPAPGDDDEAWLASLVAAGLVSTLVTTVLSHMIFPGHKDRPQWDPAALREIVNNALSTADQVRAIATASEEQSASSDEINKSILEVNERSEQTAHAMNAASGSVADLATQASTLSKLVADMKRG